MILLKINDKNLIENLILKEYNYLIDYAIENNKGCIINKLLYLIDISDYIFKTYNFKYIRGMKGEKVVKKINNLKKNG